ncbi:MAG: MotA/TolQ/ExbB proton channel family protein [Chlorobiaceae bacterium]|nr:MotA/TolQ/ExbB proton channel family protein [Chlorobiaceae bacterium]
MIDLFFKGGPVMYPLLFCSIAAFAYALERTISFFLAGKKPENPAKIHDLLEKGDTAGALAVAESSPGPVAGILEEGLRHAGQSKDQLEEVISLRGSRELKRLNQNLHILELIGRIAPLLGLLGTVLGLVEAFQEVSSAKSAIDPSMLAGGIWEALITTVAGMAIAIPAMVAHHLLENKVQSFAWQMKYYGTEAIKHLGETR